MTGWNVPPPPRPASRPIQGRRVAVGIGIALAAHLLSISVIVLGALLQDDDVLGVGLGVMLIGQAVVFLTCLTVGIVLTAKQDGGVGVGLLIGWAVGLLVAPVAGFGICVLAMEGTFG